MINIQTREGLSNSEKAVFDFYVLLTVSKINEWIRQEIKSVHIGYSD